MSPAESHRAKEISMDEVFLKRIREYVLDNISSEEFSLESLSSAIGYSRSQIHRKLKRITGKSLSTFVREIRLGEALRLLKIKAGTVSDIAYRTGFSSPAYFSKCYTDYYGITPGEVGKQEIKKPESLKIDSKKKLFSKPIQWNLRPVFIIIAVLLVAVIILIYPKIFKPDRLEQLRTQEEITVAVMPFQNLTGDTIWNIWEKGIQNELISSLTNTEELKVRQTETINDFLQGKNSFNYDSITPYDASKVSRKLNANIFIYGTIKTAGEKIRVNADLVDSKTKEFFKSFTIEGHASEEMIFQVIDSLRAKVCDFLILNKLLSAERDPFRRAGHSSSPEAYRYWIYGDNAFRKQDYPMARQWFLRALEADSNYITAAHRIAWSYINQGLYKEVKEWCLKHIIKRDMMSLEQKLSTENILAECFGTYEEEILCYKQLLEIDNQSHAFQYMLGYNYWRLYQYDKAIPALEKSIELCDKFGIKPPWIYYYTVLGEAYHKTGEYRKEKRLYKKAEKDFPGDLQLLCNQTRLALSTGNIRAANKYIDKGISIAEKQFITRAFIATTLGLLYWESELFDKAEEYYRNALNLEPQNIWRLNDLAYFLIDSERNINEGLELAEKTLEIHPDDFTYLHTKGWGLYKQGNYREALNFLQKSWDLRMENAVYNHEAFLHLEAAKKAVANQKSEN